jgi:ribosome biogenesis GTPase / thiamine phosphate phosphatase
MVEPRNFSEFDEDDVRSRPARSTRPRTKDRPDYSKAATAFVVAVDRGRVTCLLETVTSLQPDNLITAMKSREIGKSSVVVGDISGEVGTLARIVTVAERKNALTRTVDDDAEIERMIVANVDQMAIVIASENPEPRHGFVDRALVVAYDQAITPIIIMTKCDLSDGKEFLEAYKELNIKIIKTQIKRQKGRELDEIRELLDGKCTVLLGHSGVGKSTLVNALVESADRATGSVNDATGRGRHTSSSAIALALNPGWIIDTPGVRSFGVAHVDSKRVISAFGEFREAIEHCPKNCSHNEESCALNSWNLDDVSKSRLESLRRLLKA